MTGQANIRVLRAASTVVAVAFASALFVAAANGDEPPAVGQAAIAVGQAPAAVGQAPAPVGQAPAAIGQAPAAVGQAPAAIGQAPAAIGQAAPSAQPAAPAAAAAAGTPVSYSEDQADAGEKRFKSTCIDCHGDNLQGGLNGGPPLKGSAFDQAFADGAPASGLFEFMSTQMPPDSPGEFSPSVYADVMSYILKLNGYQAGAPLPSDPDALDHLIMQK